jgi:hypothetical protein
MSISVFTKISSEVYSLEVLSPQFIFDIRDTSREGNEWNKGGIMKPKNKGSVISFSLVIFSLAFLGYFLFSSQDLPGDFRGPDIRVDAPREGSCWKISAAEPHLGFSIIAEDPSGVKQMQVWMKSGHHTSTGGISTWSSMYGWTYASGGSAPEFINEHISIRMGGRPDGEYTLRIEAADMARHNKRWIFFHFFKDNGSPVVNIVQPTNNKTICKDFDLKVEINATDAACGIKRVSAYLDRVILGRTKAKSPFIGTDTTAPYSITVPHERFTRDSHTIIVIAYDQAGNKTQTSVVVRPTRICKVMKKR